MRCCGVTAGAERLNDEAGGGELDGAGCIVGCAGVATGCGAGFAAGVVTGVVTGAGWAGGNVLHSSPA